MASEFMDWFELQFGKCPSKKLIYELEDEVEGAELRLNILRKELDALTEWEEKKTVALYGWIAGKDKALTNG